VSDRKTVMVVDDNEINLRLVSDLLEIEGFSVLRCPDAETALSIINQIQPMLILMDIALPGMDGLQLTRILKGDDHTKKIKIIALTAFAMKGDKEKVIAAGCDGYITKPIDTRKFKEQISVYLE
jgi:CheY-like chemotaxis protein